MPWESLAQGLPKASGDSAEEAAAENSGQQGVMEFFARPHLPPRQCKS